MRLDDCPMEHLNNQAADVLECPMCESENIEVTYGTGVQYYKCQCGREWLEIGDL